MAPRLQSRQGETTGANVVRLKPGKAKGASGTKRKGPSTNRMKPKAHEEKPKRQSAAQKAAEKAFTTPKPEAAAKPASVPAPRIAAQPSDADIRRDLQDRLIALHTQLKPVEAKISANSEVASQLKSQKGEIRGRIQGLIPLAIYDELRKKLDQKTKRSDNELYEKQRALAFDAFGLPVGPQPGLNLEGIPEALKPAAFWEERGYQAGVNNETSDVGRDGVPPENTQDYCAGYSRAMEANARGLKKLETPPLSPTAPPALQPASIPGAELRENVAGDQPSVVAQPDWTGFSDDPVDWTPSQRLTFKEWFESLGPEDDVDILHAGVDKAFEAASLAEMDPPAPDADSAPSEMI